MSSVLVEIPSFELLYETLFLTGFVVGVLVVAWGCMSLAELRHYRKTRKGTLRRYYRNVDLCATMMKLSGGFSAAFTVPCWLSAAGIRWPGEVSFFVWFGLLVLFVAFFALYIQLNAIAKRAPLEA